jgi:hypothetical protein
MSRSSRNRSEKVYEDAYIEVESDDGVLETKSQTPDAVSSKYVNFFLSFSFIVLIPTHPL